MIRALALSALLACQAGLAAAADKTDFASELKRIQSERFKSLTTGVTRAKSAEVTKKANAELEALVKKADAEGAAKMTPEDLSAVAQAFNQLRQYDNAVKWADLAIKADAKIPSGHNAKVTALISARKLEDAEKAIEAAPALNPAMKAAMHSQLASGYQLARNYPAASKHLKVYLDHQRSMLANNPKLAASFVAAVRRLLSVERDVNQRLAVIDANLADLRKMAESKPATVAAVTDLVLMKAETLRMLKRDAELQKLIADETVAVEKAFADAKGELRGVQLGRKAKLMIAASDASDDDQARKLRTDVMALLVDEATKHRKESGVVQAATNALVIGASSWSRSDPRTAKAGLDKLNELIETLGDDLSAIERSSLKQQMAMPMQTVTTELGRFELVGKPAAEMKPHAWINAGSITPADLKGKVVLVDFWAVWCGPCIATFPHLREWNEHYGKDGLVIVGATQYYKYAWNDETKRSMAKEGISQDDERKETEKFLAHHQLKHPIAFFDNRAFSEAFKVSGIPQAVVIDRKGNIRLIKVGSGDANAKAIEAMIKKCLAEPSA